LDDTSGSAVFATIGEAHSFAGSGYQKLPSGLIIQWGVSHQSGTGDFSVTLPIAYASTHFVTVATIESNATQDYSVFVGSKSNSGFNLSKRNNGSATTDDLFINWISIGI
jgi:hypothetical protein